MGKEPQKEGVFMANKSEVEYPYPVFSTQGGGLVRSTDDGITYNFVEVPEGFGFQVGDTMPKEWGISPANKAARRYMEDDLALGEDYWE